MTTTATATTTSDTHPPNEAEWLGLCLITESNRPEEWPYIAAVIYYRTRSPRYPNTFRDVILQRSQFSFFNPWTRIAAGATRKSNETIWRQAVWAKMEPSRGGLALQLVRACDLANSMVEGPDLGAEWDAITPTTLHYYSPVSMPKSNPVPRWAPSARRLYTPEGVDPERFVFAEGVR